MCENVGQAGSELLQVWGLWLADLVQGHRILKTYWLTELEGTFWSFISILYLVLSSLNQSSFDSLVPESLFSPKSQISPQIQRIFPSALSRLLCVPPGNQAIFSLALSPSWASAVCFSRAVTQWFTLTQGAFLFYRIVPLLLLFWLHWVFVTALELFVVVRGLL